MESDSNDSDYTINLNTNKKVCEQIFNNAHHMITKAFICQPAGHK